MSLNFKTLSGTNAILAICVMLLLVLIILTYKSDQEVVESTESEKTGYRVLTEFEGLLSRTIDIETSNSGFALTGEEKFIEAIDANKVHLRSKFNSLKILIKDEEQILRLDTLDLFLTWKLAITDTIVSKRQNKGIAETIDYMTLGEGARAMDSIRFVMGRAINKQLALLSEHSSATDNKRLIRTSYFILFAVLALLIATLAYANRKKDIDLRKKADQHLKESEEHYKTILETLADNVVILNANGEITYINHVSPGLAEEEVIGSNWLQWLHEEDQPKTIETIQQTLSSGAFSEIQIRAVGTDREMTWFNIKIVRMPHVSNLQVLLVATDISESKEKQREISDYKYAIDQSAIVAITDQKGIITHVNENFCKIAKYDAHELIGKDHRIVNSGYHPKPFIKNLWSSITNGKIWRGELRNKAKDGTIYWVDTTIVPFLDEEGKPFQYMAIRSDITERKEAEKELKSALERLRFHLENSPLAFIKWDNQLHAKSWSKKAEDIFGWSEKEVMETRKGFYELAYEESASEIQAAGNELLKGTVERNHITTKHLTKDGKVIWCEWFNSVFKDDEGNVVTIMSLVNDITQKIKLETSLAEHENYLSTILQNEPECVNVLDHEGKLISMNPAGLAMIEADSEQEIFNYPMADLVLNEYRDAFINLTTEVFKGNSGRLEFEITGLKGGHRWLETHAVPMKDASGKVTSLVGVTRDITEQKKNQQERKKAETDILSMNQQLHELSFHLQTVRENERTAIAREIHDELGQQLTGLRIGTSWVRKKMSSTDEKLQTKVDEMIVLIDEMVRSVRRISTELRPVILDDLGLVAALDWQSQEFQKRIGIHIDFQTNITELSVEKSVAINIFRIYQESLTNVAKHSGADHVKSTLAIKDQKLIFSIADNGTGIREQEPGRKSWGIIGMKERALMLSGEFQIAGSPGAGTTVSIIMSLEGISFETKPVS